MTRYLHEAGLGASPEIQFIGAGLQRPECILATASGNLFMSDRRGGIMVIAPDARQHLLGKSDLVPNGIALQQDGSFLVANLGAEGGVWCIGPDGAVKPWLMEMDNVPLPRVNFVTNDGSGRVWICVSATDSGDHYPIDSASGYIMLHDRSGTRVVADGLRYTNEIRVSADGQYMFVNETFGRRLSGFKIGANGNLQDRATVAEFEAGDFPDGMALDEEGGVWVVCVGSNRLYRVTADGKRHTVIDDADPACIELLESAFISRKLTRPMLSSATGRRLKNITSIAFGGLDRRTAYLGCLAGDALATFRSPVSGLAPSHWNWDRI